MNAHITGIEFYFPQKTLDNQELATQFKDWTAEKIAAKTGINQRRIAEENECSSDLAAAAAEKLFQSGKCSSADIDYVLLCTQSPDYFLPTTACLLQDRLKIPTGAGALDFNLGCSGFIYGLSLAKGLIETDQASNVLLITAETYSKFLHPKDRSVRTIFGDAAAATLIQNKYESNPGIGPFVLGTDGSGAKNLIVPAGGMRSRCGTDVAAAEDEFGNWRSPENLYMNGGEIFTFTLTRVPMVVAQLLEKSKMTIDDLDLIVFHQANEYMLEHLRKKMKIPSEKFFISLSDCGNTVSSTIPIALKRASEQGKLEPGFVVMLVGFGVGYSWGATIIRWAE